LWKPRLYERAMAVCGMDGAFCGAAGAGGGAEMAIFKDVTAGRGHDRAFWGIARPFSATDLKSWPQKGRSDPEKGPSLAEKGISEA
jgi:hypothetical protein